MGVQSVKNDLQLPPKLWGPPGPPEVTPEKADETKRVFVLN